MNEERLLPRLGTVLFGVATAATGVLDLIWGEFEPAHQPIQALGDHIPGQRLLAYLAAAWLIAAGLAMLWRRTTRAGAGAAAVIYGIFAAFWLPRLYTAPRLLGFRPDLITALLAGIGQQLILAAAATLLVAAATTRESARRRTLLEARWTFGLASIAFGLAHLAGIKAVAAMVPKWMPLGGSFWTVLTGVAFVLAGAGILARVLDALAARLLALMLLAFSALVLVPPLLAGKHNHVAWGSNAYNLAAAAAAWILADAIVRRRRPQDQAGTPVPHTEAFHGLPESPG